MVYSALDHNAPPCAVMSYEKTIFSLYRQSQGVRLDQNPLPKGLSKNIGKFEQTLTCLKVDNMGILAGVCAGADNGSPILPAGIGS